MLTKQDWKWFGHAGHYILADRCQFHLTTQVGKYLVSTIGQLWSDESVRRIIAEIYDPEWWQQHLTLRGDAFDRLYMEQFGYEEIGIGRKFETMVFLAGDPCRTPECGCGKPEITGAELGMKGYNTAGYAARGHMEMCEKWTEKQN